MSVDKATPAQLTEWETLLEAEGLGNPEKDLNYVTIRDTDGVRIPAQPVREGGLRFRERAATYDAKQDRNRRPRQLIKCEACTKKFEGTRRARFCSYACKNRLRMRRARAVPRNLTALSEENGQ